MPLSKLTPEERAIKSGAVMIRDDSAFNNLGATLKNIDVGSAKARLKIEQEHTKYL